MTTTAKIASAVACVLLMGITGCAAEARPETPEQVDCATASPLLARLDKAQAGDLPADEQSVLDKDVTDAINSSDDGLSQVGAMLFVLRDPDDAATYYKFRAQLVGYCEDVAKWPIT